MKKFLLVIFAAFSLVAFAEQGLLLVTSEPSGAEVTRDGVSLGATPRLITILEIGELHRITLSKTGYQSKRVDVRFLNGREPIVVNEKLVLDSGVIEIKSDPMGASVIVNGIDRGKTPLSLSGIPKGLVSVTLKHEGFKDLTRELSMHAGEVQELYLKLQPLAGTLQLTTIPDGGRIYLNGLFRGKSPLVLTGIEPGTYQIKAEMDGYGEISREITVSNGSSVSEEFRLPNIMGRLEVRTLPAGAQIFIDGRLAGMTKQVGGEVDSFSETFPLENLAEGEHVLVVKKEGYADSTRHPKIQNSKTSKANVTLRRVFTPNVEIITPTGTYRGVYVSADQNQVMIEVKMGIQRGFAKSDIIKMTFLDKETK